jgi:GDP-L-fucose synthase
MNILVTGANGFLGKEIVDYFSTSRFNIIPAPRQTLDLTNRQKVDDFFMKNNIDVVLHTAVRYGETMKDFISNLTMFENLKNHADKYSLMITFGSGAEYDRSSDVEKAKEETIFSRLPADYYGLAKNLIAREIEDNFDNIINLRLFGCFGILENNSRFIKSSLERIKKGAPIKIYQNREIDFFYVKDLLKVVELMIKFPRLSSEKHTSINMCYEKKHSLVEVAEKIKEITMSDVPIIIESEGMAPKYMGDSSRLLELKLDFKGLEKGIVEIYDRNR